MTPEQFNRILHFLESEHFELTSKFPNSFVCDDRGGFFVFRPAKVTSEDYDKIIEITNKWRDENNA